MLTRAYLYKALITWAECAFLNPYRVSGAEDFPLWAATSVGIEHRELYCNATWSQTDFKVVGTMLISSDTLLSQKCMK